MHPVLRRVLLHGGLTALALALVGAALTELADLWLSGHTARNADLAADQQVSAALRARVPLGLAAWGFLFVLVGELVVWWVRGRRPAAAPAEPPPDDAEKLLNELLAQAEAKAAADARGPAPDSGAEGEREAPKAG